MTFNAPEKTNRPASSVLAGPPGTFFSYQVFGTEAKKILFSWSVTSKGAQKMEEKTRAFG